MLNAQISQNLRKNIHYGDKIRELYFPQNVSKCFMLIFSAIFGIGKFSDKDRIMFDFLKPQRKRKCTIPDPKEHGSKKS